jgi:hypothetical protein
MPYGNRSSPTMRTTCATSPSTRRAAWSRCSSVAEWAAQTLFDHLVDAVLNWLDHGDESRDTQFVAVETAAIQATLTAWSKTAPR